MTDIADMIIEADGSAQSVDSLARVVKMAAATFTINPSYDDAMALARLTVDLAAAAERHKEKIDELLIEYCQMCDDAAISTAEEAEEVETASIH